MWGKDIGEGVFRFEVRMVRYDHGHGKYEYVDPHDSDRDVEQIFVLADESDITQYRGWGFLPRNKCSLFQEI